MKKRVRIAALFLFIGVLLLFISALLRSLRLHGQNELHLLSYVFYIIGIAVLLFSPFNHPRYYPGSAGISITTAAGVGTILLFIGLIFKHLHLFRAGRSYLYISGLCILIITTLAIIAKYARRPAMAKAGSITLPLLTLQQYVGVYKNPHLGMDIAITINGTSLIGQATGQAMFPLEAIGNNVFRYTSSRIVIEFDENNNTLFLKQRGGKFPFIKDMAA